MKTKKSWRVEVFVQLHVTNSVTIRVVYVKPTLIFYRCLSYRFTHSGVRILSLSGPKIKTKMVKYYLNHYYFIIIIL